MHCTICDKDKKLIVYAVAIGREERAVCSDCYARAESNDQGDRVDHLLLGFGDAVKRSGNTDKDIIGTALTFIE